MCGADPSGDPRGSICFAPADERKNPGPSPAHQLRNDRGAEENCKAAANTLRKVRKAPGGRRPLNRVPRHGIPRSNASFETKHRPPAEFPELLSWEQSVAYETCFCENKIARVFSASSSAVCRRNAGATPTATVPIPLGYAPRLVEAENVRLAWGDPA
jgi:hypothetical protein